MAPFAKPADRGMATLWFVYMVRCADDTLYTGVTTDIERRLHEHNGSARGARYTRARRPVKIVWQEESASRAAACRREYEVRHYDRRKKLSLLAEYSRNQTP